MKEKRDVILGFDLGVGSVGWSIIDANSNEILKLGSRLFDEPKTCAQRREYRATRRLYRRKAYKNQKFYKLVLKHKKLFQKNSLQEIKDSIKESASRNSNILTLKCKALKEKISPNDLIWVLHDYLENRGYFFEVDTYNKEKDKNQVIKKNKFVNFFPSENEMGFFNENSFFKNQHIYQSDYSQTYSNKEWVSEIKYVLDLQFRGKDDLEANEFTKKFLDIFTYVRPFSQGPGSINSVSNYGRFYYNEEGEVIEKYKNLWDKTIGRCSFFKDEFRTIKHSLNAEVFNFLNNLNNLRNNIIPDFRLSSEDKIKIINKILAAYCNSKSKSAPKVKINNYVKEYLDLYNAKFDCFNFKAEKLYDQKFAYGFLKNSESKKKDDSLADFKNLFFIVKFLKKFDIEINHFNSVDSFLNWLYICDSFIISLAKEPITGNWWELLKSSKLYKIYADKFGDNKHLMDEFLLQDNMMPLLSGSSRFSIKFYELMIPKLINTHKIYEILKWDIESKNKNEDVILKKKYLDKNFLDDAILPPSVRTSIMEAIKVFNKIKKLYDSIWNIKQVVVEMAREKNGADIRQSINDLNKINRERKKDVSALIKKDFPDINLNNLPIKSLFKVFLYFQQDGIDIYDNKSLDIEKVLFDPSYSEIDHIIPYSKSLDDSSSNKVLTKAENNHKKSDMLPYEFIKSEKNNNFTWENFKELCEKIYNENKYTSKNKKVQELIGKKLDNLMIDDFSKYELKFLTRNLNDTRYATKLFKNALIDFSESHQNAFKVCGVNGQITSFLRKMIKDFKDRSYYKHHAIDASIIALAMNTNKQLFQKLHINDLQCEVFENENGVVCKVNKKTRKITELSRQKNDNLYWKIDDTVKIIKKSLENVEDKILFSRKLNYPTNKELFNATAYSYLTINNINYKVQHLELLWAKNEKNGKTKRKVLDSYFLTGAKEENKQKILMYLSHPSEYNKIQAIYSQYANQAEGSESPFAAYMLQLKEEMGEDFSNKIQNAISRKEILIFDKNFEKFSRIKKIKIIGNKINDIDSTYKMSAKSFKESLNSLGCLIYQKNGKYFKFKYTFKYTF